MGWVLVAVTEPGIVGSFRRHPRNLKNALRKIIFQRLDCRRTIQRSRRSSRKPSIFESARSGTGTPPGCTGYRFSTSGLGCFTNIQPGTTVSYGGGAGKLAIPKQPALWRAPAHPIILLLRYHAIVWSEAMAKWGGIAGVLNANEFCLNERQIFQKESKIVFEKGVCCSVKRCDKPLKNFKASLSQKHHRFRRCRIDRRRNCLYHPSPILIP